MAAPHKHPPRLLTLFHSEHQARALVLYQLVKLVEIDDEYLPWDQFRHGEPPETAVSALVDTYEAMHPEVDDVPPLTIAEWWAVVSDARERHSRSIQELLTSWGDPLRYVLTDRVLRETDFAASWLRGIGLEGVDSSNRDRFIRSALEEEAITSSQLEGAVTTRRVAKEMLRTGRKPTNVSEIMIANNFAAMQRIREIRDEPLTPNLVREIHAIVTEGTLDPADAGRIQVPGEERVSVVDIRTDEIIHMPPPADELHERLDRLCAFANAEQATPFIPGVLRALTVHFMVSYDHYFIDGNGRTARALFYWVMLRQGYWLSEFLTVSTILKNAPARYSRSFTNTEEDGGDLTYFFMYHLDVLHRAIDGLKSYVAKTQTEQWELMNRLRPSSGEFNLRQITVLTESCQHPERLFTVQGLAAQFAVSEQTARNDLDDLTTRGFMTRSRRGHRFFWLAHPNLNTMLMDS